MLKILSVKKFGTNLKATIQSTGKLGFSGATAVVLELASHTHVRFALEDETSGILYLAVMPGVDEDGFKLMQSGGYYSINTRPLFDALQVDYKNRTVIYDLQRDAAKDEEMGGKTYRMEPRYLPRREGEDGTPISMP